VGLDIDFYWFAKEEVVVDETGVLTETPALKVSSLSYRKFWPIFPLMREVGVELENLTYHRLTEKQLRDFIGLLDREAAKFVEGWEIHATIAREIEGYLHQSDFASECVAIIVSQ